MAPLCYDCLSEDVSVRVIDDMGFEHWLCAADWAVYEATRERITELIGQALTALDQLTA